MKIANRSATTSQHRRRTLPLSWAIALGFTLAMLIGILILTRDLAISNDIFKDGVAQAEKVDQTTNDALDGADQLPPANTAINDGLPEVVGVINSLNTADQTLGDLGDQLQSLGDALTAADPPLAGIIDAGKTATVEANSAAAPAENITHTLDTANSKISTLGTLLDQTQSLSDEIDSKLRIALLLPKIPG